MITDADLLRAYHDGDESALAALIGRYHRLVRAACQRQAPPAEVDDCLQAVFTVLARRPEAAAKAPALVAWLYRVTTYVCRNAVRAARNRGVPVDPQVTDGLAQGRTPAVDTEVSARLDAALMRLGERQRAAVLLHVVSGESSARIGERLGVSQENAKKLVQRGIGLLRTLLGPHGSRIGSASLAALLAPQLSAGENIARLTAMITQTPTAQSQVLAQKAMTSMQFAQSVPWISAAGIALLASVGALAVGAVERPAPVPSPVTGATPAAPPDAFVLPNTRRVSLAVYDQEGRLVRTLLTGALRGKGTHRVEWDGLDRYGAALPAGTYTWKMLASEGLRAEFLTQIGQNVNPSWERATGNHEAPRSAAIDASGLYRTGASNEGGHWGVKTDLDGKHLWTNDRWAKDPWVQGVVATTLVGERLFEVLPNGDCYGYSTVTGRVFTGSDHEPKPWNLRNETGAPPAGESDDARRRRQSQQGPGDLAGDTTNGLLVALYPRDGVIRWYSASDGTLVDSMSGLTRAVGLTVDPAGDVLVIADGAVQRLTRRDKTLTVVIPRERLQHPYRVSVSRSSGAIFVAENSSLAGAKDAARHHQVKRFDRDGRLQHTYGRPEGRVDGVYIATDFRGLTDIEADHTGGFIITEGAHTPPRRTARFAADGALQREWYGAQHYGVLACPEPDDPRFVWTRANAPTPGFIRYQVDYQARTWKIVEIYQDALSDPFTVNSANHGCAVPTMFMHQGRMYLHDGNMGPLFLRVYDPKAKRLRPCVASGQHKNRYFWWTDLNDDGRSSDDEITWLTSSYLGGFIDAKDFSLTTTPNGTRESPGLRLKPMRFTAAGTPVFDPTKSEKIAPWREDDQSFHPFDLRRGDDGSWFGSIAHLAKNPHEGAESHGAWYYNSCSAIDRLVKWSKEGRPLFSVGRHSPDNDHETGSTAMPRGLVGLTRGCVIWGDASDAETARPTVWTEDGLYVDELLRMPLDQTPAVKYGEDNTNEYPTGHLATDPQTGDVLYFALNSGGGAPVYRISGWDGWQRTSGTITLKTAVPRVAARDGTGLTGEYFNTPDCSGQPALTRQDKLIYFNWGAGTPDAKITADTFSVRWSGSYEALTNEDVRFEIRGSFPWRDRGRPTWAKLWLGGQLIFDSTTGNGTGESAFNQDGSAVGTVRVRLKAGEKLDLKLEAGFKRGGAAIALNHDTPTLDRRAVLPAYLHPQPGTKRAIELPVEKRAELLAEFSFEEPTGVLSYSRTGLGIFGRMTGTTRRVDGRTGKGLEFAPNGDFSPASFPIDEELRLPAGDYTISFWFKTTAKNITLGEIRRRSSYNFRWSDHQILVESDKLVFRLRDDRQLEAKGTFHDGQWHHVATTVGAGGQRLHVDGRLIDTGKLTRRVLYSNRLGFDLGPGGGDGVVTIDDLRIHGRALSADEITRLAKP
jgi:RNA polymerase sigma factor (sigma-70 family)